MFSTLDQVRAGAFMLAGVALFTGIVIGLEAGRRIRNKLRRQVRKLRSELVQVAVVEYERQEADRRG